MIVISDTTMWAADVPSMCTGMRGLIDAQIDLRGADTDVHSGSFGGGVPNPLHALAALLAGLHDDEGRVTLPGFYDAVLPLTDAERELFARLPFDEKAWLADAGGSQAAAGEAGYSTLERVWARPTAEVNGMWGGHTGPGAKTIVPSPGARQGVVPAGGEPGAGRHRGGACGSTWRRTPRRASRRP